MSSSDDEGPLVGSVKYYEQHLAVCTGGPPEIWAARVEEMNEFFVALTRALKGCELLRTVKVTACDAPTLSGDGFDLYLMPDMLHLPGITVAQVEALADALLHRFERGLPFDVAPMAGGDHLFVCTHANRDARCGAWGEPFFAAVRDEIEARGTIAHVHRTSHIGGHRFAATCIVYPQGIWYGNLRPDDAPHLVRDHLEEEMLLPMFYRGRLGTPAVQHVAEAAAAHVVLDTFGRYEALSVAVEMDDRHATATARAEIRRGGQRVVAEAVYPLAYSRWWSVMDEPTFVVG